MRKNKFITFQLSLYIGNYKKGFMLSICFSNSINSSIRNRATMNLEDNQSLFFVLLVSIVFVLYRICCGVFSTFFFREIYICVCVYRYICFFFSFNQKTAYYILYYFFSSEKMEKKIICMG